MKTIDIVTGIQNKTGSAREKILSEFIEKEDILPNFMKEFAEVIVEANGNKLQYFVAKDYFCIGEDNDSILMPTFVGTLKNLLVKMNCSLPTPKMVNQIYKQAQFKIEACPQRPVKGESITSTRLYVEIDKAVKRQRVKHNIPFDAFVAGHKKDVVVCNAILKQTKKDRLAIYGWFYSDGTRIQGLNAKDHDIFYVDYSHGFRFVSNKCFLNGKETTLKRIWEDEFLCTMLHDEILKFQAY